MEMYFSITRHLIIDRIKEIQPCEPYAKYAFYDAKNIIEISHNTIR